MKRRHLCDRTACAMLEAASETLAIGLGKIVMGGKGEGRIKEDEGIRFRTH